jgi:hypothetical protein
MKTRYSLSVVFAIGALIPVTAQSSPFASNVVISGTNVSFILNEPADSLTYSINGGAQVALSGAAKGTKSFTLGAPTDTFSIYASKYDPTGYSIPTGNTIAADANGLGAVTNEGGFRQISDDANALNRFNSPRGVAVNNDPNSGSLFGTSYIANSAAGSTTGVVRALGDGLYALHADQSDAFGYGNTAQSGISVWSTSASSSAPFRVSVGKDQNVYIADFSDATGNVWRMSSTLTTPTQMLAGVGGPTALPAGQNHGSTLATWVEGSLAGGDLVMYTVDEDLTSAQFGGPAGDDRNSLWRYDIGGGSLPSSVIPTKVNTTNVLVPAATSDMERGKDGKFYLAQNRGAGNEPAVVVLDSNGVAIYDSLSASRTLLANPASPDILRNAQGMAVSPDQKWMALMLNNSDVAVLPLVNGIPDLANRLDVNTGTNVNSGRDIAFDAADNIYYVSSGQALLRVLSPGGQTLNVTSWNGTSYSFLATVPEPTTAFLCLIGIVGLIGGRRRA